MLKKFPKSVIKMKPLILLGFVSSFAQAGTITNFDLNYITTDPGPYTPDVTYSSIIFTDTNKTESHGSIIWVEGDVQTPGFSVVNDDDVDASNCLMTAGENPVDMTIKQCSDPFQTSKRFKFNVQAAGSAIDLVFDVDPTMDTRTYRILQKVLNNTNIQAHDFKIELGFFTAENFTAASNGTGLDFSDSNGNIWATETVTGDVSSLSLDALFPFGLFGDADTDPNHDFDGYFDNTDRARFYLTANRGIMQSTGISANYTNLVGDFLAKTQVPNGYFFDHDNDPTTDPLLIAHETELGWITFRVEPFWTQVGLTAPPLNLDGTITTETIQAWEADPLYVVDAIEDLANLNMNYHVQIGSTALVALWPTYNINTNSAQFTIRFSSRDVIFEDGFELIAP